MLARLVLITLVTLTFNASASNPYFYDKERGWLWREEPPAIEEPEPQEPPPEGTPSPSNTESEEYTELDVAWLKANMERIMVAAINNPTQENHSG